MTPKEILAAQRRRRFRRELFFWGFVSAFGMIAILCLGALIYAV